MRIKYHIKEYKNGRCHGVHVRNALNDVVFGLNRLSSRTLRFQYFYFFGSPKFFFSPVQVPLTSP